MFAECTPLFVWTRWSWRSHMTPDWLFSTYPVPRRRRLVTKTVSFEPDYFKNGWPIYWHLCSTFCDVASDTFFSLLCLCFSILRQSDLTHRRKVTEITERERERQTERGRQRDRRERERHQGIETEKERRAYRDRQRMRWMHWDRQKKRETAIRRHTDREWDRCTQTERVKQGKTEPDGLIT